MSKCTTGKKRNPRDATEGQSGEERERGPRRKEEKEEVEETQEKVQREMVRERRVNDDTVRNFVLFVCMSGAFVRKRARETVRGRVETIEVVGERGRRGEGVKGREGGRGGNRESERGPADAIPRTPGG